MIRESASMIARKRYGAGRTAFAILLWLYGVLGASDFFPVLLTLPTFFLSMWQINRIKTAEFTSSDMLWLCLTLFFVVAPSQSIVNYSFIQGPTKGITYSIQEFLKADCIVLASILLFIVGKSNYRKAPNVRFAKAETLNIRKFTNQVPALFFAITISFAGYVYCYGGVSNIVLPRTEMNGLEVNFLATAFLSVHVISTVILAKIFANRSVLRSVGQTFFVGGVLLWSISLLLLCINPFNSPRFYILGTWVPVVFGYFGSRIKYTYAYAAILLAVIVIMPVMSVTSRVGVSGLYDLSESTYFENAFLIKDMDVFDTLVHMVRMYESRTFDLGSNLLAIVLFFVPRSFWPEKPQVGGLNIGGDLLHNAFAGTDNLSLFIGGDFYMDFGWIGVAVGFYVLGVLWKTLQKTFYTNPFNRNVVSAVVTGSLPILLRGPVGAVVGYYVCLMTAAWLYNKILYRNKVWR